MITDQAAAETGVYRVDDRLMEEATVGAILTQRVIINRGGVKEYLELQEEAGAKIKTTTHRSTSRAPNKKESDIGKGITIAEYNSECRTEVMKYTDVWEDLTNKLGYWVDMDHPYITYDVVVEIGDPVESILEKDRAKAIAETVDVAGTRDEHLEKDPGVGEIIASQPFDAGVRRL